VVVGAGFGYELGLFVATLLANARLLPVPRPARRDAAESLEEPAGAAGTAR
jgi:hypothetical protein